MLYLKSLSQSETWCLLLLFCTCYGPTSGVSCVSHLRVDLSIVEL